MAANPTDQLWRAARRLRRGRGAARRLPPLMFFTDVGRTPWAEKIVGGMPRGSAVVFRAFGAHDATLTGARLARMARARGVLFFVGADAALASVLRADGLHLPERMSTRAGAIGVWRRRFLVTAAAHSLPAALRARGAGVDAVIVSPVFASRSPSAGKPIGARAFAAMTRRAGIDAYALGGVNPRTARRLAASGAVGLAVVEGFDPSLGRD